MKVLKSFISVLFSIISINISIYAQVGINTTNPSVTLQVDGSPMVNTILDGILPPRITGNQLQNKTYGTAQNGTLIHVTSPVTTPSSQTSNVVSSGLYMFNSSMNKWLKVSQNVNGNNVYCNNNDPNSATVFDDELPVVTNDNVLKQNDENTYYGLDGSTWLWNGSTYISYNISANLNVGQRISVYKTMSTSISNGAHLPSSGLIDLDGLLRVGLNKYDNNFYRPYLYNISTSSVKISFASISSGATTEVRNSVQLSVSSGAYQGVDSNDIVYWTTSLTETLTTNVILPNGKWYEIQWFAYELNSTKHIYMTAERKF